MKISKDLPFSDLKIGDLIVCFPSKGPTVYWMITKLFPEGCLFTMTCMSTWKGIFNKEVFTLAELGDKQTSKWEDWLSDRMPLIEAGDINSPEIWKIDEVN